MIVTIPLKIVKYGELENDVITGEEIRPVEAEKETDLRIHIDSINYWYEVGMEEDSHRVLVHIGNTELPCYRTLEEFETLLYNQLFNMELSEKGKQIKDFCKKSLKEFGNNNI